MNMETNEEVRLLHLLEATEGMDLRQAMDIFATAKMDSIHLLAQRDTTYLVQETLEATNEGNRIEDKIGWRLITRPFLRKEDQLYRKGEPVRPETKILFLSGDGETNDLRVIPDFTGNKARTKPAEYYKPPERAEVLGIIAEYTEGKIDDTEKVISEMADVFYNLIQLTETDSEFKDTYIKWINFLARSIEFSNEQINAIIIAKYHHRMFKNDGKNDFDRENLLIAQMTEKGQIPKLTKKNASDFATLVNTICNRILISRLEMLKTNYDVSEGILAQILFAHQVPEDDEGMNI